MAVPEVSHQMNRSLTYPSVLAVVLLLTVSLVACVTDDTPNTGGERDGNGNARVVMERQGWPRPLEELAKL